MKFVVQSTLFTGHFPVEYTAKSNTGIRAFTTTSFSEAVKKFRQRVSRHRHANRMIGQVDLFFTTPEEHKLIYRYWHEAPMCVQKHEGLYLIQEMSRLEKNRKKSATPCLNVELSLELELL